MPGAHGGAPSSPLVASVYTGRYTPKGAPDRRTKEWKVYVSAHPDPASHRFEPPSRPVHASVSGSFAEMSREERNAAFAQHPSQIKDSKTFAEMKPRERNAAFAKHSSQIKNTPPDEGSTEPVLQTRAELALDFCWVVSPRNALAQTMPDTPPPSPAPDLSDHHALLDEEIDNLQKQMDVVAAEVEEVQNNMNPQISLGNSVWQIGNDGQRVGPPSSLCDAPLPQPPDEQEDEGEMRSRVVVY